MHLPKASLIVLAFSIVSFTLASTSNAARGPKAKSTAELLQEEQSLIVTECKLTAEQQEALKEKFKPKLAALEAWDKANADKLKAAEDAAKAARQGTDDAAKRKTAADLRTLKTEREQSTAEADKAILAVLNDQQKIILAGAKLAQTTLQHYKKASLSDEQTAKVKSACISAARDLAGFTGDDKKDKQGRQTIQKSLKWAIDNVILTPEQHDLVAPKPAAPKATPPAAPAAPAPAK